MGRNHLSRRPKDCYRRSQHPDCNNQCQGSGVVEKDKEIVKKEEIVKKKEPRSKPPKTEDITNGPTDMHTELFGTMQEIEYDDGNAQQAVAACPAKIEKFKKEEVTVKKHAAKMEKVKKEEGPQPHGMEVLRLQRVAKMHEVKK